MTEQVELAKEEQCEFLPFLSPKQVEYIKLIIEIIIILLISSLVKVFQKNGRISAVEFYRTEQVTYTAEHFLCLRLT